MNVGGALLKTAMYGELDRERDGKLTRYLKYRAKNTLNNLQIKRTQRKINKLQASEKLIELYNVCKNK